MIEDCTISENFGRGLECWGASPHLSRCTISKNYGGASCAWSSAPVFSECSIRENWAREAAGVVIGRDSFPRFTNCTIFANFAEPDPWSKGRAGGLYLAADASATLMNCTIAGNRASEGGGVYCEEGSFSALINTILWNNTSDLVCEKHLQCLTDRDPLFSSNGSFNFASWRDQFPAFVVEEPDFHLQEGSPAINAGAENGAPTTDIDGHGRPCGTRVDIGAYEFGDCPASEETFVRGDADGDGRIRINDGMVVLSHLFLGAAAPRCLDAADTDDDGTVDIADAVRTLRYLFLGGLPPEEPFPTCGIDPVIDGLDCRESASCRSVP